MSSSSPIEWKFSQVFGDKAAVSTEDGLPNEADIVSVVEFDSTGNYMATGDKGGRVVIFQRAPKSKSAGKTTGGDYRFYTEFQSHEPEFDCLKSIEIEEKVNKIKWFPAVNGAQFLMSTNDKTIKLWKIYERKVKALANTNMEANNGTGSWQGSQRRIRVPKLDYLETQVTTLPRRMFEDGHAFHINSISLNSDRETFLSADDLRINVWNLDRTDESFNAVDIKPPDMEELTEVITAAEFHPVDCHTFMYSSSRACIKIVDMRESALCDNHAKLFEDEEDPASQSFFSEILSSISCAKFSRCGRYIIARDYMTLKVWDTHMEAHPLRTIQMHEYLRPKLCELYDNDYVFDKFDCTFSGDGKHIITGVFDTILKTCIINSKITRSYHNLFHIYDFEGKSDVCVEASKSPPRAKKSARNKLGLGRPRKPSRKPEEINVENIDLNKKVLHMAWHPEENVFAIAAVNNLFIYKGDH